MEKSTLPNILKQKEGDKLYVKWEVYDKLFNNCLDYNDIVIYMMYFAESYSYSKSEVNVKLDLSNCATKSDLKGATDIDASTFEKAVLGKFTSDVQKLDIKTLKL